MQRCCVLRDVLPALFAAGLVATVAIVESTSVSAQSTPPACSGGIVGLRFDDGPFEETAGILDKLKQYKLKATARPGPTRTAPRAQ